MAPTRSVTIRGSSTRTCKNEVYCWEHNVEDVCPLCYCEITGEATTWKSIRHWLTIIIVQSLLISRDNASMIGFKETPFSVLPRPFKINDQRDDQRCCNACSQILRLSSRVRLEEMRQKFCAGRSNSKLEAVPTIRCACDGCEEIVGTKYETVWFRLNSRFCMPCFRSAFLLCSCWRDLVLPRVS